MPLMPPHEIEMLGLAGEAERQAIQTFRNTVSMPHEVCVEPCDLDHSMMLLGVLHAVLVCVAGSVHPHIM